mmetsp:Transcript_29937/g.68699  ORF Transcript_29937/g.68699 Transcript_29937/m.68699 type:complete len:259 (-) Transcript_29937:170-946(-)
MMEDLDKKCVDSKVVTIQVAVGSSNPCKVEAVRSTFSSIFVSKEDADRIFEINIHPFSVPSGVSDQPYGDKETREGATNRSTAALRQLLETEKGTCWKKHYYFGVGLEGGLEKLAIDNSGTVDELWCMAWMCIIGPKYGNVCLNEEVFDDNGRNIHNNSMLWGEKCDAPFEISMTKNYYTSSSKTASFLLPPSITDLVLSQNMELGQADDIVFSRVNSKHGSGTVGILTDNIIARSDYYVHALQLALIPWISSKLYFT